MPSFPGRFILALSTRASIGAGLLKKIPLSAVPDVHHVSVLDDVVFALEA